VAACQGGRLVAHFTNRKNAPFLFFHTTRDTTDARRGECAGIRRQWERHDPDPASGFRAISSSASSLKR
jgi:hypothetical protein